MPQAIATPGVDVVVVSYNSRDSLRDCVAPLAGLAGVTVIVADNASPDDSLEVVADLPVRRLALPRNGGFSYGCNRGWRAGSSEYVLFLNPDAIVDRAAIDAMCVALDAEPTVGAVAPRIVDADGALHYSLRRFPSTLCSLAQALYLYRLAPLARWSDELVRDRSAYERRGSAEWVSGACVMVRRSALEEIEGFDEGFFLYSEDTDICRRLWDAGHAVRFEPAAVCRHEGGASAPRDSLAHILATSRIRYARKHGGRSAEAGARLAIALASAVRFVAARGGAAGRAGQLRSLRAALIGGTAPSAR